MDERLDLFLVNNKFVSTRSKAKHEIESGNIVVNSEVIYKTSYIVKNSDKIELKSDVLKYVSRGALKLKHAIEYFDIKIENKTCMDIGSSTGGFVEVLLENKANKVYAIDVGHDQLHESIRNNTKVINMERTNIKDLEKKNILDNIDFISVDVSFISLKKIFSKIYEFLKIDGYSICLIKPQFEVGRNNINKKGIVKNKEIYPKVIENVKNEARNIGFEVINVIDSPITGTDGNKEFLICIKKI